MSALLCFRPKKRAQLKIVAFPWAGASAAALRPLSDSFGKDDDVEVHVVAYAGRGHRKAQSLARSLDDVVNDVVLDLAPVVAAVAADAGRLAVYGHSFGAVAAFAVVCALRRRNLAVAQLFAAARAAPSVDLMGKAGGVAGLTDDELVALLTRSDPAQGSLFSDPEARSILLPPVRRDLEISEHARLDDAIDVPITAIVGRDDASVDLDQAREWSKHTLASFAFEVVGGDHLFVRDHADVVAALIRKACPP